MVDGEVERTPLSGDTWAVVATGLVGRVGVANVELDRLPRANHVSDREGPGLAVRRQHVRNQEIAGLELVFVFVHRDPDMQPVAEQQAVAMPPTGCHRV